MNQTIVDTALFLDLEDETQGSLFVERARLSEGFFEQLKKHPMPLEEAAIKALANNSMALDIYCWLAYRLHSLSEDKTISWSALHAQFGRSVNRLDHFRSYFRVNLELALAVYPDARVGPDAKGLCLLPSRPPISPKLVAIPGFKARRTP